jgi:hypothetical protein
VTSQSLPMSHQYALDFFHLCSIAFSTGAPITIAITIPFSPPSTCFSCRALLDCDHCIAECAPPVGSQGSYEYPIVFSALPTQSCDSCMPPDWNSDVGYSPGICPRGYNVACSSFSDVTAPSDAVEAHGTCCPS